MASFSQCLCVLLLVGSVYAFPEDSGSQRRGEEESCSGVCTKIYLPVCGSNGATYSNKCLLDQVNCEKRKKNLPEISLIGNYKCEAEQVSDFCQRTCSDDFEPACGSDHTTYYNNCELSIAICRNNDIKLHHAGTCAGFSGRGARRPSSEQSTSGVSSAVLSEGCPDTCTGGFRPVCGSNNLTYGSDCYLELAQCRIPGLYKKNDGVCAKDCFLQCDTARDLVCGSDGNTYTNYCFLLLARCKDPSVSYRNNGPCEFVEKPECSRRGCGQEINPLCGSDGITYINLCYFEAATCQNRGLLKHYDGECKPDPRLCGRCEDNTRSLVCGSNGVTYLNHCYLILQACKSGLNIFKVSNGPCLKR